MQDPLQEADWELVSSSDDGESGAPDLEAEAAALAASFQLAEPQLGASAPETDMEGSALLGALSGAAATGEPAPGSPEGLQQLHLLAAPLPPSTPEATGGTIWGFGAGTGTPTPAAAHTGHPMPLPSDAATEAAGGTSPGAGDSAGVSRSGSGASGASSQAVSVHLRVVRSDEQEALEQAVVDLEKRAGRQERELALGRLRLSTTQAALAEECREVCKLRRVAVIACSICAFLGLKALMGCPGAAAPCFTAAATAATSTVAGHAPAEDYTNAKGAGRAELAGEDLERMVAVKVEPLAASGI